MHNFHIVLKARDGIDLNSSYQNYEDAQDMLKQFEKLLDSLWVRNELSIS